MTFVGLRKIEGFGAGVILGGGMKPIDHLERGPSKSATANLRRLSTLWHDGIFAREQHTPGASAEGAGGAEI
jgi:hypothetical protein